MAKKKRRDSAAPMLALEVGLTAALKKQSRYSDTPWQPGEIPTRNGTLTVQQPLDAKRAAHGEFMAAEKPTNRGKRIASVVGKEPTKNP